MVSVFLIFKKDGVFYIKIFMFKCGSYNVDVNFNIKNGIVEVIEV